MYIFYLAIFSFWVYKNQGYVLISIIATESIERAKINVIRLKILNEVINTDETKTERKKKSRFIKISLPVFEMNDRLPIFLPSFFFSTSKSIPFQIDLLTMRNEYKIGGRIRSKEYVLLSRGKETCFIFYFIQIVASSKLRTVRQLVPTFLFDLTFDLLLFQFMEYI